jgi:hypothetical protein
MQRRVASRYKKDHRENITNYVRIARRYLIQQEQFVPLIEQEKQKQLETLSEDMKTKITSMKGVNNESLMNAFIDSKFMSFGILKDHIIPLNKAND